MSRRFFCSVLVVIGVPAVTVMCTPAPCYYQRRTVRSCALHPGCWAERMSSAGAGGEGGERSG